MRDPTAALGEEHSCVSQGFGPKSLVTGPIIKRKSAGAPHQLHHKLLGQRAQAAGARVHGVPTPTLLSDLYLHPEGYVSKAAPEDSLLDMGKRHIDRDATWGGWVGGEHDESGGYVLTLALVTTLGRGGEAASGVDRAAGATEGNPRHHSLP